MTNKIAIFIDCENISSRFMEFIIDKVSGMGEIISIEAARDFSKNSDWNAAIIEKYAIEPLHTFSNGKNTADLRLVRAIMESLCRNIANIYVIVSSDSDFRDIILHIKKQGFKCIGFGEDKTTQSLRMVYSEFIELNKETTQDIILQSPKYSKKEIRKILKEAIDSVEETDGFGWKEMCKVGMKIKEIDPDFTLQNLQAKNWEEVLRRFPHEYHTTMKSSVLLVKAKEIYNLDSNSEITP